MNCRPEQVTALVDGALDPTLRADLEAHVAGCPACAEQAAAERRVREALRKLPRVELPPELEVRVRRSLQRTRPRVWRVLLPMAAALLLSVLWLRGNAFVVSWELALDHGHCFGKQRLPAQVWGQDPERVRAWFTAQGTELPLLPESANGLDLVGGRFCPLADRKVAHLYYGNKERNLSLYVVPGPLRFGPEGVRQAGGRMIQFLHVGRTAVALVGEEREDLSEFQKKFHTTTARALQRLFLPFLTPPERPDILPVSPVGL
jgi:anti-sigma factor (TIGR02949 family)